MGYPTTDETTTPDGVGHYNHFQHGSIYWTPATGACELHGAIHHKWASLGWEQSVLGYPTTDETTTPDGIGHYNHFQYGSIYWTPATGACELHGAIHHKWVSLGGEQSVLGYPTTDETTTPDGIGRYNHFEHGSIYWTPDTGACELHGAIRDKWVSLGWEQSVLGYPTTDETTTPDGVGHCNHFEHGSIYWTPDTGACELHGAIRDKWISLGGEQSVLGYPTTDETTTPDGIGRYNHFEHGSIYWTPATGACELHGAIHHKWASLGGEQSVLGYPTTDETTTPDGVGHYNHFEHGSIYWTPDTGACELHGAIRDKWASLGGEQSVLGYPTTDETTTPDGIGHYNHFQYGSIYWTPATGACELHGAIHHKWASLGWEQSVLGYPTTDETTTPDGKAGRRSDSSAMVRSAPTSEPACGSVRCMVPIHSPDTSLGR